MVEQVPAESGGAGQWAAKAGSVLFFYNGELIANAKNKQTKKFPRSIFKNIFFKDTEINTKGIN